MSEKKEHLVFDADGAFGACRNCKRVIGQRQSQNLRVGVMDGDEFKTAVILVKRAEFRCAACFARHKFEPFRNEVDLTKPRLVR